MPDLEAIAPDSDPSEAIERRIARSLDRAAREGDERGLAFVNRSVRNGDLSEARGRKLRFEFYRSLSRWQARQARKEEDHQNELPAESAAKMERSQRDPLKAANRKQGLERGKQWRAEKRQRLAASISSDGSDAATAASGVLRELTRLQDLHETRLSIDLLGAYLASDAAAELTGGPLAYQLALHAERLLMGEFVPPVMVERLSLDAASIPGCKALLTRREARAASPPLRQTKLISLGKSCLAWTVPNRWGLRSPSEVIDLDCPFNLAVHNFDKVVYALEHRFKGYSDPTQIKRIRTANGSEIGYNGLYRALWNHEKNEYWLRDDFAVLRQHLDARIKNFFNALSSGSNLAFVLSGYEFDSDQEREDGLRTLLTTIERLAPSAKVVLILMSHLAKSEKPDVACGNRIVCLSQPFPSEDYIWHNEADYASDAGVEFERRLTGKIRQSLEERGFR